MSQKHLDFFTNKPSLSIKEGVYIDYENKHISIFYRISPLKNIHSFSEDERANISSSFSSFLNSITIPFSIIIKNKKIDHNDYAFAINENIIASQKLKEETTIRKKLLYGNALLTKKLIDEDNLFQLKYFLKFTKTFSATNNPSLIEEINTFTTKTLNIMGNFPKEFYGEMLSSYSVIREIYDDFVMDSRGISSLTDDDLFTNFNII